MQRKLAYESINNKEFKQFILNLDNAVKQFQNINKLSKMDQKILFKELSEYLYQNFTNQQLQRIIEILVKQNSPKLLVQIIQEKKLLEQIIIMHSIIVICSLSKKMVDLFLENKILDFIQNNLKEEKLEIDNLIAIASLLSQIFNQNQEIKEQQIIHKIILDFFNKVKILNEQKFDQELTDSTCSLISIYYLNTQEVTNNKQFIEFILDYYCDEDQKDSIQTEIDILIYLYVFTLTSNSSNFELLTKNQKRFQILVQKFKKCLSKSQQKILITVQVSNNIMNHIQQKQLDLKFEILNQEILDKIDDLIKDDIHIQEDFMYFIMNAILLNENHINYLTYDTKILQYFLETSCTNYTDNEKIYIAIDVLKKILLQKDFDFNKFSERYSDLLEILFTFCEYNLNSKIILQDIGEILLLLFTETNDENDFENIYCSNLINDEKMLNLLNELSNHKNKEIADTYNQIITDCFEEIEEQ